MQNSHYKTTNKEEMGKNSSQKKRISGKNKNIGVCIQKVRGKIPHEIQCIQS
jgi:hypothetical protein